MNLFCVLLLPCGSTPHTHDKNLSYLRFLSSFSGFENRPTISNSCSVSLAFQRAAQRRRMAFGSGHLSGHCTVQRPGMWLAQTMFRWPLTFTSCTSGTVGAMYTFLELHTKCYFVLTWVLFVAMQEPVIVSCLSSLQGTCLWLLFPFIKSTKDLEITIQSQSDIWSASLCWHHN